MPANKKNNSKKNVKKSTTKKSNSTNVKREAPKKNDSRGSSAKESGFIAQLTPYIIAVVAILFGVCMYAGDKAGIIGGAINKLFLGLSGNVSYVLPVVTLIPALTYTKNKENGDFGRKLSVLGVVYVCVAMVFHCFFGGAKTFSPVVHWNTALSGKGGGVVGGFLGEAMVRGFGKVGSLVLIIAIAFVLILYLCGITPRGLWILIRYKMKVASENSAEKRAIREEESRRIAEERERYIREHTAEPVIVEKKRRDDTDDQLQLPIKNEHDGGSQRFKMKKCKPFDADLPIDDPVDEKVLTLEEQRAMTDDPETIDEINEKIFDEVMRRTKVRKEAEAISEAMPIPGVDTNEAPDELHHDVELNVETGEITEKITPVAESPADTGESDGKVDLTKIFVNPEDAELLDKLADAYLSGDASGVKSSAGEEDDLTITRSGIGDESAPAAPTPPPKKEYVFPPVQILTEDTSKRDENIKEELHANAIRLVETLKSFNVKTKIENVSRGPTITRYELLPEPGIRVRSILNLVDDISLNLATTGVRIEAPIPGKAAVGIEVPNKKRATVHLRTLIEDERFASASSKLLCALGDDVGGESVYLDIAKMPHLLIAGATGMGKSVCINSLIVSLLFNATPDEVKLILIDPKKVELNIYNGIPHLLVPVVSDPKKAAGSLSWAVSEMERRFGLIESVGVRDVNMYNKVTANDPQYEFLPYIVIIIDELADLMMTAPDDVEESVCRLMQKARAAGMHVIIGTQRPSVDVITGLIKANIPSRIAFTVASQVDSRTIIDRAGAESLIGRGDMLYMPVGASKPIRVQGAFVSEEDVEEIVTFIKKANCDSEVKYADDVMEQIEKEAAKCGMGSKKTGGGAAAEASGDDDPMLRDALELAVNSGKISTSLIQRRLSLGYGRAAKLIDRMEQLGYVSAPDGQKPREVLISKEQFMEMVLKNDENIVS